MRFLDRLRNFKFWKLEHGGSAAEFALVVLPMGLMTLAIIEAGSLLFIYNDMNNAAREAARLVAVDETVIIDDAPLTCSNAAAPSPMTAQYAACASLLGWNVGFQTDAALTTGRPNGLGSAPVSATPYTNCEEVTVTVSTTMGDAALFDPFGILGSRPMNVRATMVVEYIHDGTEGGTTADISGSVCT